MSIPEKFLDAVDKCAPETDPARMIVRFIGAARHQGDDGAVNQLTTLKSFLDTQFLPLGIPAKDRSLCERIAQVMVRQRRWPSSTLPQFSKWPSSITDFSGAGGELTEDVR